MGGFEIRAFTAAEGQALLASAPPELAWLTRNPAGGGAWLAFDEERCIALQPAFQTRVWIDARDALFLQLDPGDSIVDASVPASGHAELRTAFSRMISSKGGVGGDLAHFAWPSDEAWCADERFARFDIVRTQTLLTREVGAGPRELPLEVERLERFDHQARWLWDRCAGGFGASAIREEEFLNWRLFDRPGRACRVVCVRDDEGVLRGYAALRTGTNAWADAAVLVDWLVPHEELEVGELLRRAVLAEARMAGSKRVLTLLVEWSPWFETFQRWGFLVTPSPLFPVVRSFVRRFDHLWLRDHWWMTLADTTLV